MMKTMRLTFDGKTFQALVDVENCVIFSADIWHTYNDICCECEAEDAPKYNFHDYADEVLSNGSYYTSETFKYYNPWESTDLYQFWSDDKENMTGESWDIFIPGIEADSWDGDKTFYEQLHQLINQCHFKAEISAAVVKRNKRRDLSVVRAVNI